MKRRALVASTRMPELDRDAGSGRVDAQVRFLLDAGWSVTFLGEESNPDERHARRLRQMGVSTHAGIASAADLVEAGDFDLAVISYWKVAAKLLPILREKSPRTKVVIDSQDVHFLREARRRFGVSGQLDETYSGDLIGELNTYRGADAVIAVSDRERELLGGFLGSERVLELVLGEDRARSAVPLEERKGLVFIGNFRHLPNGEAVEFLCRDILPRLDPELLAKHPLTVVGNRLDAKVRAFGAGMPSVNMVGWVPTVVPYLEHARVAVAPLLHGGGVKGKVVDAMMTGTPMVTTDIGAEGLDLVNGQEALIANDAASFAEAITRLLVDDSAWHRIVDNADRLIRGNNSSDTVRAQFLDIVDTVMEMAPRKASVDAFRHVRQREQNYQDMATQVRKAVQAVTEPGSTVLVVSRGDETLLAFDGRTGGHFPQSSTGTWAGYHPADSASAVTALDALRKRDARYLVLPSSSFWWLHYYPELSTYLDSECRRVHSDDNSIIYDLRPRAATTARVTGAAATGERVLVLGTFPDDRIGPAPALVAELGRSRDYRVTQRWEPVSRSSSLMAAEGEADWVLRVDSPVVIPSGFVDSFIALQASVGADRAQPAHESGPEVGLPVTERLNGCVAREVTDWLPVPIRSVRAGAPETGTVLLADATPVRLDPVVTASLEFDATSVDVFNVLLESPDGITSSVRLAPHAQRPKISVLIATYERPDLLTMCLESFCDQTMDQRDFEIVVVDDGSSGTATSEVIARFEQRLPLTSARIDHAGRSAAKNLGVMLARGEIVVFFDDDDVAEKDMLTEHVAAHAAHPDPATSILGHTEWEHSLEITPVMHFLTDVDKVLFAYGNLKDGQELNWKGYWEGRISSKRALLLQHGLHDQRINYSIDVEMAWRLRKQNLKVVYRSSVRSHMTRSIDVDQFGDRIEAKGRAQAIIANMHHDEEIQKYCKVDGAEQRWQEVRSTVVGLRQRIQKLEASGDDLPALHAAYREFFAARYAKGVAEALTGKQDVPAVVQDAVVEHTEPMVFPEESPELLTEPTADMLSAPVEVVPSIGLGQHPVSVSVVGDRPAPVLVSTTEQPADPAITVIIPVWSRTPELADMAQKTIARIREYARVPTEILVIDNGSPYVVPLDAVVYRYPENQGVSIAWNAGIMLAKANVVAILNSDCLVEPGWDEALYEASTTGRRIAFPYTDHADGLGFRSPDQGGTAGWCFMMSRAIIDEVGLFDERFTPAFGEDTDYWHRAWDLGIELNPVPAARVSHARRTTGRTDPHVDWLLQAHRYKYGWKHGVDPTKAPPYYKRDIVEFHGKAGANA